MTMHLVQVSLEALDRRLCVHFSAGVGHFKRLRGGVHAIEYNAVYDLHLPEYRSLPWACLQTLLDAMEILIVQRYGFWKGWQ
jgi:hypothetical protein